jgi:hypothetical protein
MNIQLELQEVFMLRRAIWEFMTRIENLTIFQSHKGPHQTWTKEQIHESLKYVEEVGKLKHKLDMLLEEKGPTDADTR